MILSDIFNRLGVFLGISDTPLTPPPPHQNPLEQMDVFYQNDLVLQANWVGDGRISVRSSDDFYRDFNLFQQDPSALIQPLSSRRNQCPIQNESFGYSDGSFSGPPTAPRVNCFQGQLPQEEGWSRTTLAMPGSTRNALSYHPPGDRSIRRPVVIWFHGTEGSSGSVSEAIFNQNEAHEVLGDEAIVFILEARDYMLPDWEHYRMPYTHFWNTTSDNGDSNRDLLFVDALIRAAIQQYGADPERIFFMGHSNGAFAAFHYATALRDQVRGVAMSSAGWVEHAPKRSMVFNSRLCENILEVGRDYFSRTNDLFPYARPISQFPSDGSMLAFYLRGNSRDVDVSAYYTCALDQQLRRLPHPEVSTHIIDWISPDKPRDGYHFVDRAFLRDSWEYLRNLPRR